MEQLIDFHAPEVQAVLDTLLKDKSTGKNIIWATDPPEELQTVMYEPVTDRSQITTQQLGLTHYEVVLPRMMKQTDTQQQRTRKKGEVFSPAWVCNKMNNALDADWFRGLGAEESAGQFTVELPQGWNTVETPVQFPACGGKTPAWVQYVQSRRLEVTCGEAPFLASRYDAATGEMIPVARRIGILDRKLRVVSENAATEDEWRKYATHAVQSTYGYEYQGDNLLLARVNLLLTYHEKTITLSVGQLTTGVTIPEWSAVLMLSNLKSPALYMQAAFRAQNPCLFHENGTFRRKENAYVFDFDPARTLLIYEQFANDLSQDTASGKGDTEERKAHIQNLLNFFPVIGEDEEGEMIPLDAEKVLSIPRKIKSKEVVRMGFQSNFLFQNISNVFSAPQEVLDILQNFQPISEAKAKPIQITPETGADLSLNDKGEVDLDEGYVIGKAADVFGEKIYESTPALDTALQDLTDAPAPAKEEHLGPLKKSITKEIITPMVEQAKQEYGRDLKLSDQKRFESTAKAKMDVAVNKVVDNYRIDQSQLETQRTQQLQSCTTAQQRQQVNREFDAKQQQSTAALMETLQSTIQQTAQEMQQTIVRTVETNQKEQEKKGYEDTVRDHLRGFSRTIPSFLMAYGDETVTLANFDQIIPDKVFQEVTSITLEQFRFLRDGGPYINQATGQEEHFAGHLFDPVVFDDSVKEFLNLKVKLADYFDESRTEDIFDYIPPQKTNQIFTPKWVVKKMVDLLEQENPGCFDDPGKTFLDPYMKSGLYITEIVKRLYRSEKMRQAFPDDNARLEHIFAKQVYGLAPTEIIYRIAISYILGFAKGHGITAHHIRQADTLEFAKAGTMERELDKIFRD